MYTLGVYAVYDLPSISIINRGNLIPIYRVIYEIEEKQVYVIVIDIKAHDYK